MTLPMLRFCRAFLGEVRWPVVTLVGVLPLSGCAGLSEDVAIRLAERDIDLAGEAHLIGGDLALFRTCLQDRGGQCPADSAAPLPDTVPAGLAVSPIRLGEEGELGRLAAFSLASAWLKIAMRRP